MAYDIEEKPNVTCGVYLLFRKKRLVYVGQSRDPDARIKTHRRNGRQFDYALKVACPASDVSWVETALIEAMNPPQNRRGVVTPREEPVEEVVRVVVHERPRYEPPPPDPYAVIGVTKALDKAGRARLRQEVKDALKSGDIPSFYANPAFTGPGSRKLVLCSVLDNWLTARQQERVRIGWREP